MTRRSDDQGVPLVTDLINISVGDITFNVVQVLDILISAHLCRTRAWSLKSYSCSSALDHASVEVLLDE